MNSHEKNPQLGLPNATVRAAPDGWRHSGSILRTRGPFHLEATVRVLQRRPTNPVDRWEQGSYRRVVMTAEGPALVAVRNAGTIARPELRYCFRRGEGTRQIKALLQKILGLEVDPVPLQRLAEAQARLRQTALALRGMRPPRFAGLFETFLNVSPFQQVSIDAGMAIVIRLVERFGAYLDEDGCRFYMPPSAESIAEASAESLRKCGLSLRKSQSLRYLARAVATGELREDDIAHMPTGEALRFLDDLPGIGPWSASLVLLRGFGRLDVFPPGDVGAARGLGKLLHLSDAGRLGDIIETFGDRRGYLYFCALGGSLLEKGFIHSALLEEV